MEDNINPNIRDSSFSAWETICSTTTYRTSSNSHFSTPSHPSQLRNLQPYYLDDAYSEMDSRSNWTIDMGYQQTSDSPLLSVNYQPADEARSTSQSYFDPRLTPPDRPSSIVLSYDEETEIRRAPNLSTNLDVVENGGASVTSLLRVNYPRINDESRANNNSNSSNSSSSIAPLLSVNYQRINEESSNTVFNPRFTPPDRRPASSTVLSYGEEVVGHTDSSYAELLPRTRSVSSEVTVRRFDAGLEEVPVGALSRWVRAKARRWVRRVVGKVY